MLNALISNEGNKLEEGIMKKYLSVIPLALLVCFNLACQQGEKAEETPTLSDAQVMEIENALRQSWMEMISAMTSLNIDGVLAFYSQTNFKEFVMGTNIYTSVDSIRELGLKLLSDRESMGWENVEIKVAVLSADTAYVLASYDYSINFKDGQKYKGKGVDTTIWEKEMAGWKITHGHQSWAGGMIEE